MGARAAAPLVLALASALGAAEPLTLTQRQEARVDATRVALGDVAELAGGPAELRARLAAVDLGPAPAPAATRELTREFLALRLRQERVEPAAIRWAGSPATQLSRRVTRLPGAAIAQAAADYVRKTLPWPDEDLVVEVQRAPADLCVPGAQGVFRYSVSMRPGQRLLGSVPVHVTISRPRAASGDDGPGGGPVVGRASVLLHVRVFQRLLVARRRIRPGQRIGKDMVRLQRTELTGVSTEAIADLADALGQEARQDIRAFAVVTRRMLGAARVIRRGEPVTLLAAGPRMRVTAVGIAEQDGAVGQFIRVRNRDSRKVVLGRVLDSRTVQVPF
jgi:flagella basal body P-ring formation protein FlgA